MSNSLAIVRLSNCVSRFRLRLNSLGNSPAERSFAADIIDYINEVESLILFLKREGGTR